MNDIANDLDYKNATCGQSFERLVEIVKKLRSPEGCPWDKVQTSQTLRAPLIEECYEAVDAINQNDTAHIEEELGDVFLNATMIAQIFQEQGDFEIADVLNDVCSKIVRRHPHVWKESEGTVVATNGGIKNPEQVLTQWEEIKQKVEGRKQKCVLDEISYGLPPLLRAYKIQKKVAKKGFDWDNVEDVWKKVNEEIEEVKSACKNQDKQSIEEEIGDLLFSVVNLSRKLDVDPEIALSITNKKFRDRFAYVEEKMNRIGQEMKKENLSLMDKYWEEAKTTDL